MPATHLRPAASRPARPACNRFGTGSAAPGDGSASYLQSAVIRTPWERLLRDGSDHRASRRSVMPRHATVADHLSEGELARRYRTARDPVERTHWQAPWLVAGGRTCAETASIV